MPETPKPKRLPSAVLIAAAALAAALTGGGALLARYWPGAEPEASLSIFEPHAGGCAWSRYDVGRQFSDQVARFPADCQGVQTSFSPVSAEALVWFAAEGGAPQDVMLYRVDTSTGRMTKLQVPSVGDPETYAIDREGRILAFVTDQQVTVVGADTTNPMIEYDGQSFAASSFPEGVDVLVHAMVLEPDGAWKIVETRASRCCEGAAPGIRDLALAAAIRRDDSLRARQTSELLTTPGHFTQEGQDGDATWLAFKEPTWTYAYAFKALDARSPHATGDAKLASADGRRALPDFGFKATDVVQIMAQANLLLVTAWATGAEPHVYDMRTGTLAYSSKVAQGVVFWPSRQP